MARRGSVPRSPSDSCTLMFMRSIIMTISSTLLALVLMPVCLWIYSRAWINTPLVQLLPLGAVTLTLCSTLIPIGLGVFIRYKYNRVADYIVKVRCQSPAHFTFIPWTRSGLVSPPPFKVKKYRKERR